MLSRPSKLTGNNVGTEHIAKLIDFGNAMRCSGKKQRGKPQTVPYRAPEVFLRLPFDCSIDMWSFGCVMFETSTGTSLFPHCTPAKEVLSLISRKVGPIPAHMLIGWRQRLLSWVRGCVGCVLLDTHDFVASSLCRQEIASPKLIDLLVGLLQIDPEKRLCPDMASQQAFFSG